MGRRRSGCIFKDKNFVSYGDNKQILCVIVQNGPQRAQCGIFIVLKVQLVKCIIIANFLLLSSVQFSAVALLCPTLCDHMNHSTSGLPVHRQLPEFTQTHVHRVGDAIQPPHPLSSRSPPALNPSQHQGLFQ